jgi:tetratricopeptide (TPR) repeat protein
MLGGGAPTAAVGHTAAQTAAEPALPREAPAPAGGKLGLASKGQGFEDDQANQFFPDELEEAEFFIQQDLLDEAREILTSILEDVPDSPRVAWMMSRIDAKEAGEPEPPAPWERRILEEVEAQLADMELPVAPPEPTGDRQVSVDEVLQQFKKGIAETVPEDDAATHYDLGCAYRDMGLLDEALAEFDIAARAPSRAADARYLIGVTLSDQGKNDEAIEALTRALATSAATRDQRAACHYQIGVCHDLEKRLADAQLAFKQAKASGHAAIDLDRRIAALVAKVGDLSPNPGSNGAGHGHAPGAPSIGKSKNIDYL